MAFGVNFAAEESPTTHLLALSVFHVDGLLPPRLFDDFVSLAAYNGELRLSQCIPQVP